MANLGRAKFPRARRPGEQRRVGLNAVSIAAAAGFSFLATDFHTDKGVVFARFFKTSKRTGPSIRVGFDHKTKRWITRRVS